MEVPDVRTSLESLESSLESPSGTSDPGSPGRRSKRGEIKIAGSSFIREEDEEDIRFGQTNWIMRLSIRILDSSVTEMCIGILIVLNFVTICQETDMKAAGQKVPVWVEITSHSIFGMFLLEFCARLYVERREIVNTSWNWLDGFILLSGTIDYFFQIIGGDSLLNFSFIRVMRLCRLLRVLRVVWRFTIFRELRKFIQIMGCCCMTLFWAFALMCVLITIWSVIAVEIIHPIVQDLVDAGHWSDCPRCGRSFSSVFESIVTFFSTTVAGDSWGKVAIPVIEHEPLTFFIFGGVLFTLIIGVLNLVVGVIVETFAEIRSRDMNSRAKEMEVDEVEEKRVLTRIFEKIDEDQSGALSWEELREGAKKVAEFRHWLRVLDIDTTDLQHLFTMIDADNSGEIDPHEFIDAMYRLKNTETTTAARFVKHLVTDVDTKTEHIEVKMTELSTNLASVSREMTNVTEDAIQKSELSIQSRLQDQEKAIEKTIEVAMQKVNEVALETALQAASLATKKMMSQVAMSSGKLADGVHRRMRGRAVSSGMARQHSPGDSSVCSIQRQRSSGESSVCSIHRQRSPGDSSACSGNAHKDGSGSECLNDTASQGFGGPNCASVPIKPCEPACSQNAPPAPQKL